MFQNHFALLLHRLASHQILSTAIIFLKRDRLSQQPVSIGRLFGTEAKRIALGNHVVGGDLLN